MSTFFARARFGVTLLIAWALLASSSSQLRAADLSAQVLVATKQLVNYSTFTPFKPVGASGGSTPYTYSVSPDLPQGLSFDATTGIIAGQPTQMSSATYTVTVTDNLQASASASFLLEVTEAATKISLTATPSKIFAGESVTFVATVAPASTLSNLPTPTGTVTFLLAAGAPVTVNLVNGTATLTTSALSYGVTTQVVASYNGDKNYQPQSAKTPVTVTSKPTTLSLVADKTSAQESQAVTFSATLSPAVSGQTITFVDNGTLIGSASTNANGVATFTMTSFVAGSHIVTAQFAAADIYAASESGSVTVTITAASLSASQIALAADRTSLAPNETITFTATVSAKVANSGQPVPGGSVSLRLNGSPIASTQLVNGVATFTYKPTTVGSYTFEAIYDGDSKYASSTSGTTTISVANLVKAKSTLTLGTPKSTYAQGDNVTLNVSIDPATASGIVSFNVGSSVIGAGSLVNGKLSWSTADLPSGQITLTATYGGDQYTEASTSNAITITITGGATKNSTAVTLAVGTTSPTVGAAVQFSILVSPSSATGRVSLYDGATVIGSTNLVNGQGTITISSFSAGSHTLKAVYGGDNNYLSSTSSDLVLQVGKASATLTLTATPTSAAMGQSIAFTARIQPSSATGTIVFKDGSTQIGTATLSGGVAVLRISTLTEGGHSITASYAGSSAVGSATSAAVSVTVSGTQPVPVEDKNARAIIGSQLATVSRSASTHVSTLHMRMETLHDDDVPAFSNTVSFSQPGQLPSGASSYEDDPWIRGSVMPQSPAARQIEGVFGRPGSILGAPTVKEALTSNGGPKSNPSPFAQTFNVWTSGAVLFGGTTVTSAGLATQSKFALNGLTLGVDTRLTDRIRVGVAFGYSSESNDLGTDGTKASSSTMAGSLYSSFKLNSNVFVDSSLGYGSMTFKSTRYDTGSAGLFSGTRSGKLLMGSLAVSYDRTFGQLKLAPYLRAEMASATLDAYTEQGDLASALVYQAQQVSTQNLTLGLRSQYDIERSWGMISPGARVEYRRSMGGSMMQPIAYASDPQTTYVMSSVSLPTDLVTATIGVKLRDKKQMSGSVDYVISGAQGGVQGQGLRGAVNKAF